MKVTSFVSTSYEHVNPRYVVYLAEIRKRFAYVILSLFFAWLCAYIQRVSLMYSITLSLQKSLPQQGGGKQVAELSKKDHYSNNVIESLPHSIHNHAVRTSESEGVYFWKRFEDTSLLLPDKSGGGKLSSFQEVDDLFSSSFSEISQDGAVRLIFTDVEEAFYTLLSVSLFWCVWACFPVLVYHTLCFFQPGFHAGQSQRVCASVLKRIFWGYLVLWLVDLFLIPRLLSFFYSFQIERSSLCLYAETKVLSYVSLYVFVYSSTVVLLLLTGLWGSYRRRQILDWVRTPHLSTSTASQETESTSTQLPLKGFFIKRFHLLGAQFRDQRGKIWWGCLLVASFLSPPDISSQFACALLLILWSEVGIWLAYTSSCRFSARRVFLSSNAQSLPNKVWHGQ